MTRVACTGWLFVLAMSTVPGAAASPDHAYRLGRGTVLPGGASLGSGWTLRGTIGQPDAGRHEGGGYVLRGGFWPRGGDDRIFHDGFDD